MKKNFLVEIFYSPMGHLVSIMFGTPGQYFYLVSRYLKKFYGKLYWYCANSN